MAEKKMLESVKTDDADKPVASTPARKKSAVAKAKPRSAGSPVKKNSPGKNPGKMIAKTAKSSGKRESARNGARKSNGQALPSRDDVAVAAYFHYRKRLESGDPCDEVADWFAAESELAVA